MSESTAVAEPEVKTEATGEVNPGEANPAPAGKDGGTPASQATLQTASDPEKPASASSEAPKDGTVAPATPPAPAPARTEAQIIADHDAKLADEAKEQERQDNIKATQADLRAYRREAPVQARDLLDDLAAALDVTLTPELRKPFLDLVNAGIVKGEAAARLDFEDEITSGASRQLTQLANATEAAFFARVPESMHDELATLVNGKPVGGWTEALVALAPRIPAVRQAIEAEVRTSLENAAPEGEERTVLGEKLKAAKTLSDAVKAFGESRFAAGVKSPPGEPRGGETAAGGGTLQNMRQVSTAFTRREISRDDYYDYRARNSRGQFPS